MDIAQRVPSILLRPKEEWVEDQGRADDPGRALHLLCHDPGRLPGRLPVPRERPGRTPPPPRRRLPLAHRPGPRLRHRLLHSLDRGGLSLRPDHQRSRPPSFSGPARPPRAVRPGSLRRAAGFLPSHSRAPRCPGEPARLFISSSGAFHTIVRSHAERYSRPHHFSSVVVPVLDACVCPYRQALAARHCRVFIILTVSIKFPSPPSF